ncbi:hypothetical protein [Pseudomonas sp. PS02290]|uniref:hypothetical protein n=1 Tax=Pseudomonas sp. PS02290 TaxID=2991430 RepID=UPI002499F1E0|nr:hypothetical protein [Pseudomonas sp. PS02290]
MAITPLEQTLIDNARAHQEALAAYYPKHQAGQYSEEDHSDYLMHSGALTELLALAHSKSGLSGEAAEQMNKVEAEDAATFRQHFPIDTAPAENIVNQATTHVFLKPQHVDFRLQDGRTETVDVSKAKPVLELGGFAPKV